MTEGRLGRVDAILVALNPRSCNGVQGTSNCLKGFWQSGPQAGFRN